MRGNGSSTLEGLASDLHEVCIQDKNRIKHVVMKTLRHHLDTHKMQRVLFSLYKRTIKTTKKSHTKKPAFTMNSL